VAGLFYEDFEVGKVYKHSMSRTVTDTDNLLFTSLCMNTAPLHLSEEYGKNHTIYGQRLVTSVFTLGLVMGMSVSELVEGTSLGNLSMGPITFPNPVFIGDTITAETEIPEKRESKSRPTTGIVTFLHRGFKQDGSLICECHRVGMSMRRPGPGGSELG
jgi:acyl dehydratase